MTKLSLALAAAILIGCGSEGVKAADEAPLEIKIDSSIGLMTITSLEDSLKIYSIIVNRGNCEVNWWVWVKDNKNRVNFKTGKGSGNVDVWSGTEKIETIPIKDFYDKYGTDKALGLNFGEKGNMGVSAPCNPLEVQVDTDKGAWTFSFR